MGKVLVTGAGIITSIGNNFHENHSGLLKGVSGVRKAVFFESAFASQLPFGEVALSNETLRDTVGAHNERGLTRTCLLARKAFEEAIEDAGISANELASRNTAFISASTVGGMCITDQLYADANLKSGGSEFVGAYGCSAHALSIIKKYGIKGLTDTINTACSSSANAIAFGARLIRSGRAHCVIVGGVDSLAKYTVNGFNALKILSSEPSRPFDENRDGLNLGEGAAYLVLESEERVNNKKVYAEICGYGNANDAYHSSAMSDEATGAILSMNEAISMAGITAGEVSYINAHGTGTPNNDYVESVGMSRVFQNVPAYSSTKSYTGHTLGAAGAVEAVYSILSIQNGEVYPSLNIETPVVGFDFQPVRSLVQNVSVEYVLSNSFGFGGNCTSLLIGSY